PDLLDDERGGEGRARGHDLRVEAGGQTGEGEPGQRRGVESVGVDDVDVLVVLVKSEGGVRIAHREASACCEFDLAQLIGQLLGDPERAQQRPVCGDGDLVPGTEVAAYGELRPIDDRDSGYGEHRTKPRV